MLVAPIVIRKGLQIMKNVVNRNMANTELNVSGKVYMGDATGVYAMEDEHADRVLQMPGWADADAAPVAPEDVDPVGDLRTQVPAAAPPAPAAEAAPPAPAEAAPTEPPPAPEETPAETPEEPEEEDQGPDLEAATSKKALQVIADEYGVKLSAKQKKLGVPEIRAILDKEIYGEGGD